MIHTSQNSTQSTSLDRQPGSEPEPEPESEPDDPLLEPSDPNLTKAPPPSYRVASNFPSHDLKADLPPPYPGGLGTTAPLPPTGASDAVCPPPTLPGYPQTTATASDAAYPPLMAPGHPQTAAAPDTGTGYPPSWTSPAYPPPSAHPANTL